MINDKIEHLKRYAVPHGEAFLKFIAGHDCAGLPDGEIAIEGRDLFVKIMSYHTKAAHENKFEIHQQYADIQYIAAGAEIMQTARLNDLETLTAYDPQGDYQFFKYAGPASDLIVKAGEFTVFYPLEPHRTTCAYEGFKGIVKKLVFKVKI